MSGPSKLRVTWRACDGRYRQYGVWLYSEESSPVATFNSGAVNCLSLYFVLVKPMMRHFAYQCVISVLKACYLSLASPVFHCEGYMAISSANWLRCVSDLGSGMPDTQRLKSVGDMVAPVVSPPWVWGVDCVRGSPWNRSLCCWDSWEEKLRGHRNVNRKSRCSNCKTQASISL